MSTRSLRTSIGRALLWGAALDLSTVSLTYTTLWLYFNDPLATTMSEDLGLPRERLLQPPVRLGFQLRYDAALRGIRVGPVDAGGSAEAATEPQRSGGEAERFSPLPEQPAEPPIRVRADDGGQPFMRCRVCRYDNPVGARVCSFCEADLTTPAQRSFNEALWDRTLEERAEYKQEAERIAAERRKTDAQYAQAMRELQRLRLTRWTSSCRTKWGRASVSSSTRRPERPASSPTTSVTGEAAPSSGASPSATRTRASWRS